MKKTIFVLAIAFATTLPQITFAQAGAEYISIGGFINEKAIPVLETIHADGKVEKKELEAGKGMLGAVKSLESIRIELVLPDGARL